MLYKRKNIRVNLLYATVVLLAVFLYGSPHINISIKSASPFIFLPLIVAFSTFFEIWQSVAAGLLLGSVADSVSSKGFCANTIVLFCFAVFVCLGTKSLFNKNIKAVVAVCFSLSVIYFLLFWLFFLCGAMTFRENGEYLLLYAFPSALYSTVFVIPLFYLFRYFETLKNK